MTYITSSSDCTQQTIRPILDIESLNEFFQDITEFIHDNQQGECVAMTAQYIVHRSIKGANSYNCSLVSPCAEMVELMIQMGWLKLVAIGTTFDDQLLYEI